MRVVELIQRLFNLADVLAAPSCNTDGSHGQQSMEKLLVAERRPTKQPLHLKSREEPAHRSRLRTSLACTHSSPAAQAGSQPTATHLGEHRALMHQ